MSSVAVIGGGRWARVILGVLSDIAPDAELFACSPRGATATAAWVEQHGLARQARVLTGWPDVTLDAAVVANAARDHEAAAIRALRAGVPVLVEKPLAPTSAGAERIIDAARSSGGKLATAHVFLFASYLQRFAGAVAAAGGAQSLRIVWADPGAEVRYGEAKTHDASLPVEADVLPHVVSIADVVIGRPVDRCVRARTSGPGALAVLELRAGSVSCGVELARGAAARKRLIEVVTGAGTLSLDFAVEPGVVTHGSECASGDPAWSTTPRPLARMLTAFLGWAGGGAPDHRLDPHIGLRACRLADQALSS